MLTKTKIDSLKPKDKPYKTADVHGLFVDILLVESSGGKNIDITGLKSCSVTVSIHQLV